MFEFLAQEGAFSFFLHPLRLWFQWILFSPFSDPLCSNEILTSHSASHVSESFKEKKKQLLMMKPCTNSGPLLFVKFTIAEMTMDSSKISKESFQEDLLISLSKKGNCGFPEKSEVKETASYQSFWTNNPLPKRDKSLTRHIHCWWENKTHSFLHAWLDCLWLHYGLDKTWTQHYKPMWGCCKELCTQNPSCIHFLAPVFWVLPSFG